MSSSVQDFPPVDEKAAANGRRRPGRRTAAPELIPLLRAPAKDEEISEDLRRQIEDEGELPIDVDPIATARGVALGVALSAPMWLAVLGAGYALLR